MTLCITMLYITTLILEGLFVTLSIEDNQHTNIEIEYQYNECNYADLFIVRLNVFMLSVVLLSVIALYFEPSHIMFSRALAYLIGASYKASL